MLDDSDDLPGDDIHPLFHGAPKSTEFRKLRKRLVRETRAAIQDYGMVRPGDRWLVCLSGGKDSYTLLAVLHELKWRGLLPVDLLACNLDQGQPNFPATVLPQFGALRTGSNTRTPIPSSPTRSRPAARCVRCARACGVATCTGSRARKAVQPSCWATTATTSLRRSS